MTKPLKITLISIISFVLLLVGFFTAVVNAIDPNQYKPRIIEAVQKATGRQFNIGGKIEWSLFPWLSLNLQDVTLGNAAGFGEKPFLSVEQASASIKLIPLAIKHFEIRTLSLSHPQINLMRNSSGINNWDDFTQASTQQNNTSEVHASKKGETLHLSIDNIEIDNGQLNWNDAAQGSGLTLSQLFFSAKGLRPDHRSSVQCSAHFLDELKHQNFDLQLASKITIGSSFNDFNMESLKITLGGLMLKGNVKVEHLNHNPSLIGDLTFSTSNLKKSLLSLGLNLPNTGSAHAFQNFSTQSHFEGTLESLRMENFKLMLDASQWNGQATLTHLITLPTIRFILAGDKLNIDDYLPVTAPSGTAATSTSKTVNNRSEAAPNPFLKKIDLQGQVTLKQLTVMHLNAQNLSFTAEAIQGLLQIKNLQATLYEGSVLSDLSYDLRTNTPKLNLRAKIADLTLQPFLQEGFHLSNFSGKANFSTELNSQNASGPALLRTLGGSLIFSVTGGQIQSLDLFYPVEALKALLAGQNPPPESATKVTTFDQFSGTARIINGIVNNNDFILESKDKLMVKGFGTLDLPNEQIQYMLKVHALNAGDLSQYDIPVTIKGPLTSPSVTPDVASLVKQAAVQTISQQLGQQAGNLIKQIGF